MYFCCGRLHLLCHSINANSFVRLVAHALEQQLMPITAEQLRKVILQHTTLFAALLSSKAVINVSQMLDTSHMLDISHMTDMSHVHRSTEALT